MRLEWSVFHDLNVSNIKKYVPTTGGVYTLWWQLKKTKKWWCYYVGQGKNLEKRIGDHLLTSEPNACIRGTIKNYKNKFHYAKLEKKYRDGVETYLIEEYKTLKTDKCGGCNVEKPEADPIEVNLPD